jgi:hypothetical protein
LYERFCILAAALRLPQWNGAALRPFLDELLHRADAKARRLRQLVPGMSEECAREAICRATSMLSWQRMNDVMSRIMTQRDLEEEAWDLIDLLPVCYEPGRTDMPLSAIPRVVLRSFANHLQEALRLDAPHAYRLTARLFCARNWTQFAGATPFIPLTEPLYTYAVAVVNGSREAWLEPCAAAARLDDEFDAMMLVRHDAFLADLAQNDFVDQAGLLAAASNGALLAMETFDLEGTRFRATTSVKAAELDYPSECRLALAAGNRTHLHYVRLRAALYTALLHSGKHEEADIAREILVARGSEYRAEYERLLRQWAPRDAKALCRTALRLVT